MTVGTIAEGAAHRRTGKGRCHWLMMLLLLLLPLLCTQQQLLIQLCMADLLSKPQWCQVMQLILQACPQSCSRSNRQQPHLRLL